MLLKWFGFLFGYITVLVSGGSPERFINLCAVQRRDMWGFQSVPQGLTVQVRVSEYKQLRAVAKQAGVHLHILGKHGLPFWVRRYRHRYGLVVGAVLFVVILQALCGRIWTIQINGVKPETTGQMVSVLEEFGIKEGVKKSQFDWATVRQSIIVKHPEISWMSFNVDGTLLQVDISESVAAPEIPDASQPCNLKAAIDGVILEMQVNTGKAVVKVGDAVVKGDLLVSGAVEYADGCTVFRHAGGKVIAQTNHTVSFDIPMTQTCMKRTGKTTVRRVLSCFGISVPLYLGSVAEPYDKEMASRALTVSGVSLPLAVNTAVFYETQPITVMLTEEEAMAEAAEKVDQYIAETLASAEILNVEYEKIRKGNTLTVTAKLQCKENITFEEKLLIF